MNTNKIKCWDLRGNNCGLIWLKENLSGSILKCHVSIGRKMADFMSVSTEKTVYKSTCKSTNLQWPSDHHELQISLKKVILLEKVTWISELSSEKWLRKPGTFLRKQFQSSLTSIGLSVCSSLWILIRLSVLLEHLNYLIGST